MPDSSPIHIWRTAAADPAITQALEGIYSKVADEIASRSPTCWSSGCCCHFEQTGHRLYATGLETAYTLTRLQQPPKPEATLLPLLHQHPPTLTPATLADAAARGTCPFLSLNLCSIHPIRPLGCRIYFCDPAAQSWQNDLSEQAMTQLRALHDEHQIPYHYAEWRHMLSLFLST